MLLHLAPFRIRQQYQPCRLDDRSDGTATYSYEALGRLTTETDADGRHVVYTYDRASNRITVTENGVVKRYSANALNRYTQVGDVTITYDADANILSKPETSGTTNYTYDAPDRVIRVDPPTGGNWVYTYDALGRRGSMT